MIYRMAYLMEQLMLFRLLPVIMGERFVLNLKTALIIMFNLSLEMMINEEILPSYMLLLAHMATIFFVLFQYEGKLKKKLIAIIIAYVIIIFLQLCVATIGFKLMKVYISEAYMALMINSISLLMIMFVGKMKLTNMWRQLMSMLAKNSILVCLYAYQIATIIFIMKKYQEIDLDYVISFVIFSIMITILMFKLSRELTKREELEKEKYIEDIYSKAFHEMIKEVRRKQHNFDNHINALESIYQNNNQVGMEDKLLEYKEEIKKENRFNKMLHQDSSPVITGFMFNKLKEAQNKGIEVEEHIVIGQAECKMSQYKLIEILGILIDNAIEASLSYEKGRYMFVEMIEKEKQIYISIKNLSKIIKNNEIEKFFVEGYRSKGDGRGVGLAYLKECIKKVKGSITAENEKYGNENLFVFNISVPK